MKNSFSSLKYIFCIMGVVIWVQAFYIYQKDRVFTEKAKLASGKVLRSSANDRTFVSFVTTEGKQIKFSSHTGNNPSGFTEGESVEVLYDPANPNNARINDFYILYLGVTVLGFIGAVFFFTGFSFFRSDRSKQKKTDFLQQGGKSITTKFIDVQVDLGVSFNDSNPYFICTEWLDPKTNKTLFFESDDIWFDPTEFIKTDEIKVLIDPNNPKKYTMDISFLPVK